MDLPQAADDPCFADVLLLIENTAGASDILVKVAEWRWMNRKPRGWQVKRRQKQSPSG